MVTEVLGQPEARAFALGCDARMAGQGFNQCPYDEWPLADYWREGWVFHEEHYGEKAGRYPIRRMPWAHPGSSANWKKKYRSALGDEIAERKPAGRPRTGDVE